MNRRTVRRRLAAAAWWLALVVAAFPSPGAGAGATELPAARPPAEPTDGGFRAGIHLPSLTSTRSLAILAVAGVGAAWAAEETDESQHRLASRLDGGPTDLWLDLGNTFGSGRIVGGSALILLSAGHLTGHRGTRNLGADLSRSYLYSGAATGVIKHAVNRRRPNGGPLSFPSGHTTAAFSTVPVVWHHLGPLAGAGTALLATGTALGRIEENRHYLSDVLFGAAIGLVVGQAVIRDRSDRDWLDGLVLTGDGAGYVVNF